MPALITWDQIIPKDVCSFSFTLVKKTLCYKAAFRRGDNVHEDTLTSKGAGTAAVLHWLGPEAEGNPGTWQPVMGELSMGERSGWEI